MTLIADRIDVQRPEPGFDVEIAPEQYGDGVIYVARHPGLPGCTSHGSTPDEALENLADAREMYLEGLRRSGQPVPQPHDSPRVNVLTAFIDQAPTEGSLRLSWRLVAHE
jgi:predicted RNase H-like HicB family nuclease